MNSQIFNHLISSSICHLSHDWFKVPLLLSPLSHMKFMPHDQCQPSLKLKAHATLQLGADCCPYAYDLVLATWPLVRLAPVSRTPPGMSLCLVVELISINPLKCFVSILCVSIYCLHVQVKPSFDSMLEIRLGAKPSPSPRPCIVILAHVCVNC